MPRSSQNKERQFIPQIQRTVRAIKLVGHYDVVARLVIGGEPPDRINYLAGAALIEAAVLGDEVTSLQHAKSRDYAEMVEIRK